MFLAKDFKSAKRAAREKFLRIYGQEHFSVNSDRIVKKSDPRAVVNIASVDKDPDRLRGGTNHYVHWSETAFSKLDHGETIEGVYGKVIDPTTRMNDGYVLIETTLNGKNGFHSMWENADSLGFARLLVSLSQMLDMKIVTQEDYDKIQRTVHPLIFAQEYECTFVTFQGRAYDEFDEDIHVAECPPPESWQQVVYAADWGWSPSATAAIFGYIQNDVIYIWDEIYEKEQLLNDFYADLMDKIRLWSIESIVGVGDHEKDRLEELTRRGVPCGLANKTNVMGARMEIKERLWSKRIVIHPRCVNLIRDLKYAVWHPKKEGQLDDSACSWGHWDSEAALRYLVRELGNFERDEPEVNPHILTDQASARMWNTSRGIDE